MVVRPAMSIVCSRCNEQLEADARFCGVCGATLVDRNLGRTINHRYVLHERIGFGSLGIVYRAEQLGLGRKLAIKMLPADAQHDPSVVERFRREGETLCRLRSAHTVTTYEFDRDPDGSLYIAMELSPGRTVADVLRTEGPMGWPRVLHILSGLCDALAEAHSLGVIHRDLRPESILLESRATNRSFVKVLDFGLAKILPANLQLSPVGQTVGAVEYSSPEQLMGRPIDGRSDLYALGVLGYLMLTGEHPLAESRTYGDLVAAHVHRVPPPVSMLCPGVPADVEAMITRCLEKDPDRRFPDAMSLDAMIGLVLSQLPHDSNETIRER